MTKTTMPLDVFLERNRWKRALVEACRKGIKYTHLVHDNHDLVNRSMPPDSTIKRRALYLAQDIATDLGLTWDDVSVPDHEEREVLRGVLGRDDQADAIVFHLVTTDGRMHSARFSREVLVDMALGRWHHHQVRGTFRVDAEGNVSGQFDRTYPNTKITLYETQEGQDHAKD